MKSKRKYVELIGAVDTDVNLCDHRRQDVFGVCCMRLFAFVGQYMWNQLNIYQAFIKHWAGCWPGQLDLDLLFFP